MPDFTGRPAAVLATLAAMIPSALAPSVWPSRRYRVSVGNLAPGMYVAALDRPWLDTPFMLEGFVLDNRGELETLQRYCRYVYVDPDRSEPAVATHAQAGAASMATGAASGATRRPERLRRFARADVSVTAAQSDAEHAGLLGRTSRWIRSHLGTGSPASAQQRWHREALARARQVLPANTAFESPSAGSGFDEALAPARAALQHTLQGLAQLAQEMRVADAPAITPAALAHLGDSSRRLAQGMGANADALLWLVHVDAELREHACAQPLRVALNLLALARSMGLTQVVMAELALAALLTDAGMARLPRAWLERPGMLTALEHESIKGHVAAVLQALHAAGDVPPRVRDAIAQHHERLDGSGYPAGLAANEISPWGRMLAIADCYTALVSHRPYAEARSPQQAMTLMHEWAGILFDGALVEQFALALGHFPVGSLVALRGGGIALVRQKTPLRADSPVLLLLASAPHQPLPNPALHDPVAARTKAAPGHLRIAHGMSAGAFPLPASRRA